MPRMILAAAMAVTALFPATAEEFSARGDHAMWCYLSLTQLLTLSFFTDDEFLAVAEAADRHGKAVYEEFIASGMDRAQFGDLTKSYDNEVLVQVGKYAANKDESVLRFEIKSCLGTGPQG